MWEICENKGKRVGKKVIEKIEQEGMAVCKWPEIYGDKNNGGVIWYPEDCKAKCYATGTAFDSFLEKNGHTKQSFTTETFTGWPLEDRVFAHITSLMAVLDERR